MVEGEYFHVGIVVANIAIARERFADLLGVMWGPIIEREPVDVGDESGSVVDAPFKLCYSTAQPYVELIEEIPGSEWECNEYSNLHHIGFWTDSVDADSGRWSAARCPLSLSRAVDGEKQMAYHRALGVRLELVNTTLRPRIEEITSPPPAST